jgi:predicted CoA-binding protein
LKTGRILADTESIRSHLKASKTIAVAWLSPKSDRDSHRVASYLIENGYRIIPVRPGQKQILGEKAYSSLDKISDSVDIVVFFRNPSFILEMAKEAGGLNPKLVWMQEGIVHHGAALLLNSSGIDVVMNRCIKVDHEQFFGTTPTAI